MSSPYDWPRGPWQRDPHRPPRVPDSELRVSNAERDEVSNALCRHFSDGRLDEVEFNERLEKATAAKTRADLAPLLADLPPLPGDPTPPPGTGNLPHPVAGRPRRLHPVLAVLCVVFVVAALGHFASVAWHFPWLVIGVIAAVWFMIRRGCWRGRF